MPAVFRSQSDQWFEYTNGTQVKERDGQFVIYDKNGNVLGAHSMETIAAFTTDIFIAERLREFQYRKTS